MRTVARLLAVAIVVVIAGVDPALAWWRYAEWGKSEEQIVAASRGQAVPCRQGVPVCTSTLTGAAPRLFVESVEMVGLPGSTSFVFDAKGELIQTIVLFPAVDFGQASSMLQGIHGKPAEDRPDAAAVRVWRDERRGSIVTATAAGAGTILVYKPMN